MAQVIIQNFAIDSSDISSIINLDNLAIAGTPSLTASAISATFTDGRAITLTGAFQPVIAALNAGTTDPLLAGINQVRLDSLNVTVNGTQWVQISNLNLTGPQVLDYIQSSGVGSDPTDDDFSNGAAFIFQSNDTIQSGPGDDVLNGYGGDDIVLGMNGNDFVDGGNGNDDVNGNLGEDTVFGGEGADFVRGGQGTDFVFGENGNDWHVNGNIGNDTVYGNLGNDTVFGGQGDDFVVGDDFAYGEGGNDSLIGNLGNDTLVGDPGNDTLAGSDGVDVFAIYTGDGNDLIVDFDRAHERIELEPNINGIGYIVGTPFSVLQLRMTADGQGNTIIDLGAGNSVKVLGVLPGQFTAANFDFIF